MLSQSSGETAPMARQSSSSRRDVMVLAAVVAVALIAVAVVAVEAVSECSGDAVYPYWSICSFQPAKYYGEEVYQFQAVGESGRVLAPEWDESNSTYYVRLSDVGAIYKFTHQSREIRSSVSQSDDVIIVNVDTNRTLAWRQEGEDEYFLVEEDIGGRFEFAADETVLLPCPLIINAICEAYQILDFGTSLGLAQYEEDGAIYFKRANSSSDALLPFLLLRSISDAGDVLKMPA